MRVARDKIAESRKLDENESIAESLIDLYLSVKIRSNEEVSRRALSFENNANSEI